MGNAGSPAMGPRIIEAQALQALIGSLRAAGYAVLGPTVRDGAIVYDRVASIDDLPRGWTDRQEAGSYRLERRSDDALFGFAVGPHSWKRFLHPPVETLWHARAGEDGIEFVAEAPPQTRLAFIGVRSCEIRAIEIQDEVLLRGPFGDAAYAARRDDCLIVAVNCSDAGGTCFCTSMNAGPKVRSGFDLALTELLGVDGHRFLVEVGSDRGAELLRGLPALAASAADADAAARVVERTAASMGRALDTAGIKALLQSNPDHPRWDDVAARCLSCGNCTMVCPTCFCTAVEDIGTLDGGSAQRLRKWDSCFTLDFSYIHGGSVRHSTKARYRQWLTHKLANWIDQFGSSGCVGCGRCITWCPVGIDLTAEVAAIRSGAAASSEEHDADH